MGAGPRPAPTAGRVAHEVNDGPLKKGLSGALTATTDPVCGCSVWWFGDIAILRSVVQEQCADATPRGIAGGVRCVGIVCATDP